MADRGRSAVVGCGQEYAEDIKTREAGATPVQLVISSMHNVMTFERFWTRAPIFPSVAADISSVENPSMFAILAQSDGNDSGEGGYHVVARMEHCKTHPQPNEFDMLGC